MENVQIKITAKQYSKSQVSLMTRSMLIAGIAFLILGACSYGWSVLFANSIDVMPFNTGLLIFLLTLLTGMVVSSLWVVNMFKSGSIGLTMVCYILYILSTSVAFGWLFSLAATGMELWWLPVIFAITGIVFLLTFAIAKIVNINHIITFGKIIGITAIAMAVIMIIFLVLMIVFMTTLNVGVALSIDAIGSLIMMGMAIVSFLYVIIDIWQISKISEFAQYTGTDTGKFLPWFFGFRLLTDLVNILFILLMFIIRFSRR